MKNELKNQTSGYHARLQWVYETLNQYGVSFELINRANLERLSAHPNFDIEDEDGEFHANNGDVILITSTWILPVGNIRYRVFTIHMDTEHDWCRWKTSMVMDMPDDKRTWHSLDLRLITTDFGPQ